MKIYFTDLIIMFMIGLIIGGCCIYYFEPTTKYNIINTSGNINYEIRTNLEPLNNYEYSDTFNCQNFTQQAIYILNDTYYSEPLCVKNDTIRHAMIWVMIPVEPQTQYIYTKDEFDSMWNITECSKQMINMVGE